MKVYSVFYVIIFFCSCKSKSYKFKTIEINKVDAYGFINKYIEEKSKFVEYQTVREAAYKYFEKSVLSNRENYIELDTSKGEKFYGVDSLVIFSKEMDSAILFYMLKLSNSNKKGYYFSSKKIFAVNFNDEWVINDKCPSAVYTDSKYSYTMAKNNERLWFVYDGKWLYRHQNDSIEQNFDFLHFVSKVLCD